MKNPSRIASAIRPPAPGFALVSAIALLVVLAVLGAYLGRIATSSQIGSAQDIQSARAYQAARAGLEWGLYQVLDPGNALGMTLPSCPSAATLTIDGFSVAVSCNSYGPYNEGTRSSVVFSLVSTSSAGAAGSAGYVERQVRASVSKCRDPGSPLPGFSCG